MSDYAIQTRHLTRYFGDKRVVYDLSLSVPRGSIFGFLVCPHRHACSPPPLTAGTEIFEPQEDPIEATA